MAKRTPLVRGDTLVYQLDDHEQALSVGTAAWYAWLTTASTFAFTSAGAPSPPARSAPATSFGLPLVVIPFFADQLDNAARCAALEVGRVISPSELSPEKVREHVSAVLGDRRYKRNALQIQAEMHALPGVGYGVRLLERLATEGKPIVSR